MISLTFEQQEKIRLIDKLFGSLSTEQLKELAESEQIVARLKGTDNSDGIISEIVSSTTTTQVDLMNTRAELSALKNDFQTLLRALNLTVFSPQYNNDFNTLKNKHSVY